MSARTLVFIFSIGLVLFGLDFVATGHGTHVITLGNSEARYRGAFRQTEVGRLSYTGTAARIEGVIFIGFGTFLLTKAIRNDLGPAQ